MGDPHDPLFRLRECPPTPTDELCACEGPWKLMASVVNRNLLHCVRCSRQLPLERLAVLEASLIDDIAGWNLVARSIDGLWIDSGDYEAWALQQMRRWDSPVNRRGVELARAIDAIHPCFYWLPADPNDQQIPVPSRCPGWGGEWGALDGERICSSCCIGAFGSPHPIR